MAALGGQHTRSEWWDLMEERGRYLDKREGFWRDDKDDSGGDIELSYGVVALTGANGAGKSLAPVEVVMDRLKTGYPGRCGCGEMNCDAEWTWYTNMEQPVENGLALPLSYVGDMPKEHSVHVIDEAYLYMDSREWKDNKGIGRVMYQQRKRSYLIILTAPSIDDLDKRVRGILRAGVEVWCPIPGELVLGILLVGADPTVSPLVRAEERWDLEWNISQEARDAYNTKEFVDGERITL